MSLSRPDPVEEPAGLPRRRPGGRRDAIINAALELFARQGYQATGIDEIGGVVGISGPAIYRHFASKQQLLAAAFSRALEGGQEQTGELLAAAKTPDEALENVVRSIVRSALDDRLLLSLYAREVEHLPREERRVVHRRYRELTGQWAGVLREVYPRLAETEARMAIVAAINLIGSVGFTDAGVARGRLEDMLTSMSLAALHAAGQHPAGR